MIDAAMFLSPADLTDLTGYQIPAYQARWLEKNGFPFELSAFRKPRVLKAYVEQRLGLASAKPLAQTEPDFSHWEAA